MIIRTLILFSLSFPAFGYNLTKDFLDGFYWASLPINIKVTDNEGSRKNDILSLAKEAVQEWEENTGLSLWDVSGSASSNLIRWSNNFAQETNMDPTSVLAVAIRYTNGPYFAKTEIVINGQHNSFNTGSAGLNRMNLKTTLVHELGHTMGLDHSENMQAIMAPSLQVPYPGLHEDDVRGISDVHAQMQNRQITRYISPLSYSKEASSGEALSCGTTAQASGGQGLQGILSLVLGLLSGFVGRISRWVKSLF